MGPWICSTSCDPLRKCYSSVGLKPLVPALLGQEAGTRTGGTLWGDERRGRSVPSYLTGQGFEGSTCFAICRGSCECANLVGCRGVEASIVHGHLRRQSVTSNPSCPVEKNARLLAYSSTTWATVHPQSCYIRYDSTL